MPLVGADAFAVDAEGEALLWAIGDQVLESVKVDAGAVRRESCEEHFDFYPTVVVPSDADHPWIVTQDQTQELAVGDVVHAQAGDAALSIATTSSYLCASARHNAVCPSASRVGSAPAASKVLTMSA